MTKKQRAVCIFNNFWDTEVALQKMFSSCGSLERVSVMAANTDRENQLIQTLVCESLRDRFDCRISTAIRHSNDSVEDDVVSLSDALIHLKISLETARRYNYLVARGRYLIMIEGAASKVAKAIEVLNSHDARELTVEEIDADRPKIITLNKKAIAHSDPI